MSESANSAGAQIEFLGKYLEHLERKDSREGATKWVLLAAMAAVIWQFSSVLFEGSPILVIRLVVLSIALYFLVLWTQVFVPSKDKEGGRIRFLSRSSGAAEAAYVSGMLALCLTASFGTYFLFDKVPRLFRVLSIYPIALFAAALVYMLLDLRNKYNVVKPSNNSWRDFVIGMLLVVAPMLIGLYAIFQQTQVLSIFIDPNNLKSIQAAGLAVIFFFVARKYAETLQVDGEIAAVRRIWRRHGIGEMGASEALKELRLIVAGASLNEVISSDVNRLAKRLQELEELESQALQELARFQDLVNGDDTVAINALKNSLAKRRDDIESSVMGVDVHCHQILEEVKRLLRDQAFTNAEAKEFKESLEDRCRARRSSCEETVRRTRAVLDA